MKQITFPFILLICNLSFSQTSFSSFNIVTGTPQKGEKDMVMYSEMFGPINGKYYELNLQNTAGIDCKDLEFSEDQINDISQLSASYYPDELFNRKQAFAGLAMSKSIFINRFSDNLTLEKALEVNLKEESKYSAIEFVLESNDKLYFFYSISQIKGKEKYKELLYKEVDLELNSLGNSNVSLNKMKLPGIMWTLSGGSYYEKSPNKSKILILSNNYDEKKTNEVFYLNVLDADMKKVFQKELSLEVNNELFRLKDFKVDNLGNVYILGKVFDSENEIGKQGVNYTFRTIKISEDGVSSYDIKSEEKPIVELGLGLDQEQNLICTGFYSTIKKDKEQHLNGTCFIKLNGKLQKVNEHFHPFEYGLSGVKTLAIDDIIRKKNGDHVLFAENKHTKATSKDYINNELSGIKSYNFEDIYIIRLGNDGELKWQKTISKNQVSENNGQYFSYYIVLSGDQAGVLYNDNLQNMKNVNGDKPKRISKESDAILAYVSIGEDGTMTKEKVGGIYDNSKLRLRPFLCKQVSESEHILFIDRKKEYSYLKFKVY